MHSTTEITSADDASDNVIHQRLFFAYVEVARQLHGKVLELGCGAGRGMHLIHENAEHYTGVDKIGSLLEQHRKQYPNSSFLQMDMPPMKLLPDASFDCVVSFQVIEHIENDALFVEEIGRVLKPGGKAYLTTPNRPYSLTRNPWHVREYIASELTALFKPHFAKVEMQGVHGSAPVKQYYEENKVSVKKITRFDVLDLQHRLPRKLLQVPYEVLNRLNRKKLQKGNNALVDSISIEDYHLGAAETSYDLFVVAEKGM